MSFWVLCFLALLTSLYYLDYSWYLWFLCLTWTIRRLLRFDLFYIPVLVYYCSDIMIFYLSLSLYFAILGTFYLPVSCLLWSAGFMMFRVGTRVLGLLVWVGTSWLNWFLYDEEWGSSSGVGFVCRCAQRGVWGRMRIEMRGGVCTAGYFFGRNGTMCIVR